MGTLLAAAPAVAQTEAPARRDDAPQAPVDDTSGDIVVTAQKRSERLLDVPISMAAVSGKDIEEKAIASPAELFTRLPNVSSQFASNSDGLPIFNIRGVTLLDFSETNESSVATYVDEVYIGSPAVQNGQLFDLDRIEVLRGPQGTLWGRNATGGVISWVTRKPTRTFEADFLAGYGSWGDTKLQAAVSGPLSDSVRARVAASFNWRGGTVQNLFPGGRSEYGNIKENLVLRGTVEADLASNFKVSGNLHYGRYIAQSPPRGFFGALDASGERCAPDQIFAGLCYSPSGLRNADPSPREAMSELKDARIDNEN